jgi:hypothetical protein
MGRGAGRQAAHPEAKGRRLAIHICIDSGAKLVEQHAWKGEGIGC